MSIRLAACSLGAILAASVLAGLDRSPVKSAPYPVWLTRADEPGGTDADAALAMSNPDEYAWQLFFFISRQAKEDDAGIPDPSVQTFRDDQPGAAVVWESWALASGGLGINETFCREEPPVVWDKLRNRESLTRTMLSPNRTEALLHRQPFLPPTGLEHFNEVRFNQQSYDTVAGDLWYSAGISDKITDAKQKGNAMFIAFPSGSKQIKAVWVQLCKNETSQECSAEKDRYHWRNADDNGKIVVWGLAALHVTTKEEGMPNWFWADFIHADCLASRAPCVVDDPALAGQYGLPRDTTSGSDGVRDETRNTPWQNYRLMGTETGFTVGNASSGAPQILFDPAIEKGKTATSCITCHYYASTTASAIPPHGITQGTHVEGFDVSKEALTGAPRAEDLMSPPSPTGAHPRTPERLYFQSDFSWSLINEQCN
jgi:hypothetical protein